MSTHIYFPKESSKESRSICNKQMLELLQINSELPIVIIVDDELCSILDEYYDRWNGVIRKVEIGAYVEANEHMYIRGDAVDDVEEVLNNTIGEIDWYSGVTYDEIEAAYDSLPWIEAIIVHVGP